MKKAKEFVLKRGKIENQELPGNLPNQYRKFICPRPKIH